MKRLFACLALAALLALAAPLRVQAIMTKEEADKQGIRPGQKAGTQKPPAAPPAGAIRTEDGKTFIVPKAKGKGRSPGDDKQQ